MKITALVENTSENKQLVAAHGLSLYIETDKHKILIDTANGDAFLKNAQNLGIDIAKVDILIVTHGHFDHGGGLNHFLNVNSTAKIYLQASAFDFHFQKLFGLFKVGIGLDAKLKNHPQMVLVEGDYRIDSQIQLIANPSGKKFMPKFNEKLCSQQGKSWSKDQFQHEQSVIVDDGKVALIGGCAHRGIANIIDDAKTKTGKHIDLCVSGFHLFNPASKATEDVEKIKQLAAELQTHSTKFFTCHCTGQEAYKVLKFQMKEGIDYLSTGRTVVL